MLLSSLLTIPSEKKMKTNSLAVDGSETLGLVTEDLVYFVRGKFFGWRKNRLFLRVNLPLDRHHEKQAIV